MLSNFADDGLFCGTDPKELWSKKDLNDYLSEAFKDTQCQSTTTPLTTVLFALMPADAQLTALEQFTVDVLSPKIPVRLITHVINKEGKWLIDFQSWSMIPTNEDLVKVNEKIAEL